MILQIKNNKYLKQGALVLLASILLSLLLIIQSNIAQEAQQGVIVRNNSGMGKQIIPLIAKVEGKNHQITLEVEERVYQTKEAEEIMLEMLPALDQIILGDNTDIDHITYDLNLVGQVSGYPFLIRWFSSREQVIDTYGKVYRGLEGNSEITELTALIQYGENEWEYTFSAVVLPLAAKEDQWTLLSLRQMAEEAEKNSRNKAAFSLPDTLEGSLISWQKKKGDSAVTILFLGIFSAGAICFVGKREEQKLRKKKKDELKRQYPELVSRLALYIGAGMTLQKSVVKLAQEYENRIQENTTHNKNSKKMVYEEILTMRNEMVSGIAEMQAYSRLGSRVGLKEYKKLSTLMVQGLKRGSTNLLPQLEQEAKQAMEMRKQEARRRGEEAGTKLLLPMMIMLFIVMLLIMVPALGSFSI